MSSELPPGWRKVPVAHLGEIAGGPFGSSLGRKDYVESGVPVIRGTNLSGDERFNASDFVYVSDEKADTLARNLAVPGDVVFTQRGTLGQVGVVPEGPHERYVISQSQMRLRVDPEQADAEYMFQAFRSPRVVREIKRKAISVGVPHINMGILAKLEVALPPVGEQRRIAAVLHTLDRKIEHSLCLAGAADQVWLAFAEQLSRGAPEARASDLVDRGALLVGDGYRAKNSELTGGDIAFLRAGNLTASGIDVIDADRVPDALAEKAGSKRGEVWDSAFTSKGTVGRITLVGPESDPFVYSPQVCFWRSTDRARLSPFMLHAWMQGRRFARQVDAVKGQTDMAEYVSLRDQRAMFLPVPPSEVQAEIDRVSEPLALRAAAARAEARRLRTIREELLPRLLTGAHPVAEDYAAEALTPLAA